MIGLYSCTRLLKCDRISITRHVGYKQTMDDGTENKEHPKMHPLAYEHLKKIVHELRQIGPNESCDYYPCHFEGQDCTWCFCPFYPCEDEEVGGSWVERTDGSRIWGCSRCFWIHRSDVAQALLNAFAALGIEDVAEIDTRRVELMQVFQRLKKRYPPELQQ